MTTAPTKTPMNEFCRALPKVELHAHLNGSLSVKTLRELGCVDASVIKYIKLISSLNNSQQALDQCFELFQIAHDVTDNPSSVYLATKRVIEEFASENVIYLELRTTPRSEPNMTKAEYVEAVIKAIKENKDDITIKLILSINRSHNIRNSQDSLEAILKLKKMYPDIIKGIDLSGNPKIGRFESEIFRTARENGLHTTIHCAEVKDDKEVKEILEFGPDRIGHGTCLHPNYGGCKENWELLCQKRIPLECCITSNVICETSENYQDHHMGKWIKEGLPFCICTDDKGVFCTSLSREYLYVHSYQNLSKQDLWRVSLNAVDYSFASNAEKLVLKTKLAEWERDNEYLFSEGTCIRDKY